LAEVTCPIGVPGIAGKEPDVIALAVAAQLLQIRTALMPV
jgi:xanthine dehydrogenase accessory factor